jgi:hypothetical protein
MSGSSSKVSAKVLLVASTEPYFDENAWRRAMV